tara:strand:+ start:143 stop:388 length:246 start_codon:yes stop_codon:yes gene_type:complete
MSKKTYEHKYVVYQISDGPKVITESLNSYGQEGWYLTNMVTIANGENLVAWMVKESEILAPNPEKSKEDKINTLWTEGDSE